jgi:hypothetical protein
MPQMLGRFCRSGLVNVVRRRRNQPLCRGWQCCGVVPSGYSGRISLTVEREEIDGASW